MYILTINSVRYMVCKYFLQFIYQSSIFLYYIITYSIKNYNGEMLTVNRNVVVQHMGITLTVDTKELHKVG